MIKDFDTVWQMYVTVSCGANDAIELLMPNSLWPFPTYSDLLLYI